MLLKMLIKITFIVLTISQSKVHLNNLYSIITVYVILLCKNLKKFILNYNINYYCLSHLVEVFLKYDLST